MQFFAQGTLFRRQALFHLALIGGERFVKAGHFLAQARCLLLMQAGGISIIAAQARERKHGKTDA
jgi:hypothetical protein